MFVLLLTLACSSPPQPTADQIAYGDSTVKEALDRALAASRREGDEEAEVDPSISPERLALLEERISRLELLLAQLQQSGTSSATLVGFDPRSTTLSATTVQGALDELEARVARAESKVGQDMGQAGPGMFSTARSGGGGGGMQGGGMQGGGGGGGMQGGGGGGMQGGGGGGMQGGGGGGGMQGGGGGGGGGGMQGGGGGGR